MASLLPPSRVTAMAQHHPSHRHLVQALPKLTTISYTDY